MGLTKAGGNDKIYDVTCSHELIEMRDILERYCSIASTVATFRYSPQVLQITFCFCLTFGEQ